MNVFGLLLAVSPQMNVIQHNDVSEDQELSGDPGFVQGITGDLCESRRSEYWKSVFSNRREVESGRIFRDLEHRGWRRSLEIVL